MRRYFAGDISANFSIDLGSLPEQGIYTIPQLWYYRAVLNHENGGNDNWLDAGNKIPSLSGNPYDPYDTSPSGGGNYGSGKDEIVYPFIEGITPIEENYYKYPNQYQPDLNTGNVPGPLGLNYKTIWPNVYYSLDFIFQGNLTVSSKNAGYNYFSLNNGDFNRIEQLINCNELLEDIPYQFSFEYDDEDNPFGYDISYSLDDHDGTTFLYRLDSYTLNSQNTIGPIPWTNPSSPDMDDHPAPDIKVPKLSLLFSEKPNRNTFLSSAIETTLTTLRVHPFWEGGISITNSVELTEGYKFLGVLKENNKHYSNTLYTPAIKRWGYNYTNINYQKDVNGDNTSYTVTGLKLVLRHVVDEIRTTNSISESTDRITWTESSDYTLPELNKIITKTGHITEGFTIYNDDSLIVPIKLRSDYTINNSSIRYLNKDSYYCGIWSINYQDEYSNNYIVNYVVSSNDLINWIINTRTTRKIPLALFRGDLLISTDDRQTITVTSISSESRIDVNLKDELPNSVNYIISNNFTELCNGIVAKIRAVNYDYSEETYIIRII